MCVLCHVCAAPVLTRCLASYGYQCASMVLTSYSSVFVYSSMLSSMVLPALSSLRASAAPSEAWVEARLGGVPKWARTRLCRPMPLLEDLQARGVLKDTAAARAAAAAGEGGCGEDGSESRSSEDKDDTTAAAAVVVSEVCRKRLGVSEFFTKWYRNMAVILIFGSLTPLVAIPVFVGSVIETRSYRSKLRACLEEVKSSSPALHEVGLCDATQHSHTHPPNILVCRVMIRLSYHRC